MDKDELIKQQAGVIEQMREAVETFLKQYPHMAKGYLIDALDLQPCPEVLNKVRADAVREFHALVQSLDGVPVHALDYADRIEQGEA